MSVAYWSSKVTLTALQTPLKGTLKARAKMLGIYQSASFETIVPGAHELIVQALYPKPFQGLGFLGFRV